MQSGAEVFFLRFPEIARIRHFQSVHQQVEIPGIVPGLRFFHHFLNADNPVREETGIAVFLQPEHQFHLVLP